MSDLVTEFLAKHGVTQPPLEHSGVKGMRWGVRKDDRGSNSGVRGAIERHNARKVAKAEKTLNKAVARTEKKIDKALEPAGDNESGRQHLRAVAAKSPHELSDQELREVLSRANQIKQYEQLFNAPQKSPLELKVQQLQLQKQYFDLQKALNPPQPSRVEKFQKNAGKGFDIYVKMDKQMKGALSGALTKKLGLVPPKTQLELLTESTDLLKAQRSNKKAIVDLRELEQKSHYLLRDDIPSFATGYAGAGKRKKLEGKRARF